MNLENRLFLSGTNLVTVGYILVDEIISQDEANRRFPALKWPADFHVCACPGKEISTREKALAPILNKLRFVSTVNPYLDGQKPLGNQLQRKRELTQETSKMLMNFWNSSDDKDIEEYAPIQYEHDCFEVQEVDAKKGFVYILVNPAFPGFLKVGKTTKTPEIRARELSSGSGVPAPYAVAWDELVTDCDYVEKVIHQQLAHTRSRKDREFFSIPLKTAIAIVTKIVTPFSCETDKTTETLDNHIENLPDSIDFPSKKFDTNDQTLTKDELIIAWKAVYPKADLKFVIKHLIFCRELRSRILSLDNNITEKFAIDLFAFFKGDRCFFAIHPQSSKVTLAPITLEIHDIKHIELTGKVRDISSRKYKLGGLFRVDISDTNNANEINIAFELAKRAFYSDRAFETWNLRSTLKSPLEERVGTGEVKKKCDVYSRLLESMELGKPQLHRGVTDVTAYIEYNGNGFNRICVLEHEKAPQNTFSLAISAGDTCTQAKQLFKYFSNAKAEALKQNGWNVEANFHLAWQRKNILFAKGYEELSLGEYISFWRSELKQGHIRKYDREEFGLLQEKLRVAKVMNGEDNKNFDEFFRTHKYQSVITCPGIGIWISYSQDRLNDIESLSTELRDKTLELIKIFDVTNEFKPCR